MKSETSSGVGIVRDLGVALAVSFAAALLLALPSLGAPEFPGRVLSLAGVFSAPFCGYALGNRLWQMRVRQGGRMLLFLAAALVAGVLFFFLGTATPPVMGESENRILFPGLLIIGLASSIRVPSGSGK
jgi:hypothetical protein